jgi:hypothetical protein
MRAVSTRPRALRLAMVIACTLMGAFTATCFVTGWSVFRDGPVTSDLGRLDTGRDSHAAVIEVVGAGWDLGVPFPAMWGQPWMVATSQERELFIGSSTLASVRTYLDGASYAFAGFEAGQWQVRSIPGQMAPGVPGEQSLWRDSESGPAVAIPARDVIVVMRADAGAPVRAEMSAQFRPERAPVILVITGLITAILLITSVILVRGLRVASAARSDVDG